MRPEVVLHHKARLHRPQDTVDLEVAWPLPDPHAQAWLCATARHDHPWLAGPMAGERAAGAARAHTATAVRRSGSSRGRDRGGPPSELPSSCGGKGPGMNAEMDLAHPARRLGRS